MQDGAGLSVRIDLPGGGRFGPGKAALLSAIAETGSLAGAARALDMSYPKSLRLVREMNRDFAAPLVETFQGGSSRGGAGLTPAGQDVLAAYLGICRKAAAASGPERARLAALLRSPGG